MIKKLLTITLLFSLSSLQAREIYNYLDFKQDIINSVTSYNTIHKEQNLTAPEHENEHLKLTQRLKEDFKLFETANSDLPDTINKKLHAIQKQLEDANEVNTKVMELLNSKHSTIKEYQALAKQRAEIMKPFLQNIKALVKEIDMLVKENK